MWHLKGFVPEKLMCMYYYTLTYFTHVYIHTHYVYVIIYIVNYIINSCYVRRQVHDLKAFNFQIITGNSNVVDFFQKFLQCLSRIDPHAESHREQFNMEPGRIVFHVTGWYDDHWATDLIYNFLSHFNTT